MVLAGFVVAWDAYADETLSNAFMRARESENRLTRIASVGALAITACHLMDYLPEKYDPFDNCFKFLGKLVDQDIQAELMDDEVY